MSFPRRAAALALAPLLFAALPAAGEDLTIVSRLTRDGGPPTTATSYISGHHARMVQGDGQEAIVDLQTGQMTLVDHGKKEYFVVTRQEMDEVKARIQERTNSPEMQRAQEQMKNLPPEVQKRMQGMMGAMVGSADVRKMGTRRTIAGYTCLNWTITMGPLGTTEQCMTTELELPAQAWDSYRELADGMKGLLAAAGPMGQGLADLATKMKQVKGFPLATTTTTSLMGRTMKQTMEVVEVKKGPIPASAWQVPAGYKKIENPMAKGLGAG
ncbi:MAG TPA: DUF4412 domain-containing protein [Vicinamibacteria bacterium]|nr:DUF4412 domain-containing protein [Vicinamibacteria bacterium]